MIPLIIIYLFITYLLVRYIHLKYRLKHLTIGATIINIFFPIGGIVLLEIILRNRNPLDGTSITNLYEKKENHKTFFFPDINIKEESDIAPLDDILILSDLKVRRKTVLNVLKKGSDKYINFINKAVKNEDSETTHYAAVSLMHTKGKLDKDMTEQDELYKQNPMDPDTAITYFKVLDKQANIAYIEESIKRIIISKSISLLQNIVDNKLSVDEEFIIRLIELLIQDEEFDLVTKYIEILKKDYIDTEAKYMALLEAYYLMKDSEKFQEVLWKIKEENIPLSKEAYHRIRFW